MMKKSPHVVTSVPDIFDISIYENCSSWGLKEWSEELSGRSFMNDFYRMLEEGTLTDSNREYYLTQAEKFLLYPIKNHGPKFELFLSPIIDQSAEELFKGHHILSDRRYRDWVKKMEDTSKYGDQVLHGIKDVDDQEVCRNVHEFISTPAWKVHRDSLGSNERFFIGVDLRASDDYLLKQFKSWITKTRKEANINNASIRLFDETKLDQWHEDCLLPYLDLSFWAAANSITISSNEMEVALFPGRTKGVPGERVRRTIAPKALSLISKETIYALNTQLRTYQCAIPE
jgi:hypothetical protein